MGVTRRRHHPEESGCREPGWGGTLSPRSDSDVLGAEDRASGDNCKEEGEPVSEALGSQVRCSNGSLWGWRCSPLSPPPPRFPLPQGHRQILNMHNRSQRITTDYNGSQRITTDHNRSPLVFLGFFVFFFNMAIRSHRQPVHWEEGSGLLSWPLSVSPTPPAWGHPSFLQAAVVLLAPMENKAL